MYGIGNVPEFADQTPITIEEARKKASLRTEQSRSKWKIKHDSHHPKYVFKEGDLVIRKIAFNDPRLIKTSPKYEGPFMLQKAFKDDCISRSQSGKWHKTFKEGREEVTDEPRSGRSTTARTDENVDRVLEVLRTDRRLSIQQIADTLHMSTFVVHGIVTENLQMQLLDLIQNEPDFLNSVVTGDDSWMFEYDPESKRQSCAWHTKSSPRPKKARMSKSRIKTMIIVFFDIRGIVHYVRTSMVLISWRNDLEVGLGPPQFVPQGQTVNSAFYLEVLRRLKRRIARVRTDIKDTVKLHHDKATSHTAFIITNFLPRSNTSVIPHPLTVPT
ncbi:hypothetical protein LAZ67_21001130 [Cordylochernes scorpioides]|uniref:Transposase n=1 Tax=Cordylochernes scorpioides TaxID=51811 RepID=A0ABY6LQY4_9ARAC|nr:hypothetical protein LAZ67_21001130 [Cordylochernes scorpioides]